MTTETGTAEETAEGTETQAAGDAPPASTPQGESPPATAAKDGATSGDTPEPDLSKVPAHLHPVTKKLLDERKALREQIKSKEDLLKDPRIARLLAQGEAEEAEEEETTETTPDEQSEALKKLSEMLGLGKVSGTISELKKIVSDMNAEKRNREYTEAETSIKAESEKLGYDWESEVEPLIQHWFLNHPEFTGLGAKSLNVAFKAIFFDRQSEVSERAANLKLINAQKQRQKQTSESTGNDTGGDKAPKELNIQDFIKRRISESGGVEV